MIAAINKPLTVYGSGNQTRTFLNINDTLQCIELAIKNPAKKGEYKVRNQFTETFSVYELAKLTQSAAKKVGINLEINLIKNPRVELEKHYYNPTNKSFLKIGLKPIKLTTEYIQQNIKRILNSNVKIDKKIIDPKIKWEK